MPYTTIVALDVIELFLECEPKQILPCGSDSTCLGEIWKFQSPYLPVWNVVSVIAVNMDPAGCQI